MCIDYKYQFANNKTYVCPSVENVVSDDFFNSKKSSEKGQKAEFKGVLLIFVGYALVLLLYI